MMKHLKLKKYKTFFCLALLALSGCQRYPHRGIAKIIECPTQEITPLSCPDDTCKEKVVTVWVHGTRAFFQKFLFRNYFYTKRGLNCALSFDHKYHLREVAEILHSIDPQEFCINDLYFYGWSGKLSFKARYKTAKKLYKSLTTLVQDYESWYGYKPRLRLITHSHGGNVALNLAQFNHKNKLSIEELILLACPVQTTTCNFTADCMFKKIYSLYSRYDSFQILDPQKVYYWLNKDLNDRTIKPNSFFSERVFPFSEKMLQVQLKFNSRGIMHIEFITNKFVRILPSIMREIRSWDTQKYFTINTLTLKLI